MWRPLEYRTLGRLGFRALLCLGGGFTGHPWLPGNLNPRLGLSFVGIRLGFLPRSVWNQKTRIRLPHHGTPLGSWTLLGPGPPPPLFYEPSLLLLWAGPAAERGGARKRLQLRTQVGASRSCPSPLGRGHLDFFQVPGYLKQWPRHLLRDRARRAAFRVGAVLRGLGVFWGPRQVWGSGLGRGVAGQHAALAATIHASNIRTPCTSEMPQPKRQNRKQGLL